MARNRSEPRAAEVDPDVGPTKSSRPRPSVAQRKEEAELLERAARVQRQRRQRIQVDAMNKLTSHPECTREAIAKREKGSK